MSRLALTAGSLAWRRPWLRPLRIGLGSAERAGR